MAHVWRLRTIVDGLQTRPAAWSYPGNTAMNFRQRDKNPVLGRHRPCTARPLQHPRSPRFSISTRCCCGDATSLAAEARRGYFDRGAAYEFSCPGSLAQGGSGYSWRRWYLPINGTKVARRPHDLMTQGPKAPFMYTEPDVAGREGSNQSPGMVANEVQDRCSGRNEMVALESAGLVVLRDRSGHRRIRH